VDLIPAEKNSQDGSGEKYKRKNKETEKRREKRNTEVEKIGTSST
jgi:hypothetical protein